jgi:hypothetical protein
VTTRSARTALATVVFAVLLAQVLLYPGIDTLVAALGADTTLDASMWFLAAEFGAFVLFAGLWGAASDAAGRRVPFIVAGALGGAAGYALLAGLPHVIDLPFLAVNGSDDQFCRNHPSVVALFFHFDADLFLSAVDDLFQRAVFGTTDFRVAELIVAVDRFTPFGFDAAHLFHLLVFHNDVEVEVEDPHRSPSRLHYLPKIARENVPEPLLRDIFPAADRLG